MKLFPGIVALVAVSALLPACKGVPDHVIPPDEMSELLADRHIAEAVVDYNGPQWRTDSQRIALRDAVYLRHGVTQADVDTSLDWYGHNIGRYMEVYDRTIEILESRITGSDARVRAEQVTIAGDSVDVWPASRFYAMSRRSPARSLQFALNSDENSERGDLYTWRAKFANNQHEASWTVVAEYADSTLEYIARLCSAPTSAVRFGSTVCRWCATISAPTPTASVSVSASYADEHPASRIGPSCAPPRGGAPPCRGRHQRQ